MGYWDTLYLILEYCGILDTRMNLIQDTSIFTGYCNTRYRILEYYGTLNTGHWNTMGYWLLGYLILDFEYFDYYGIIGTEILKDNE